MLVLHRDNAFSDSARNYKIIIDDCYYGDIKNGEIKNIDIKPGNHTIHLTIDWCRSNKINFTISENETIEFECGNSLGGWKFLLSFLYITIFKNKYLWIKNK